MGEVVYTFWIIANDSSLRFFFSYFFLCVVILVVFRLVGVSQHHDEHSELDLIFIYDNYLYLGELLRSNKLVVMPTYIFHFSIKTYQCFPIRKISFLPPFDNALFKQKNMLIF